MNPQEKSGPVAARASLGLSSLALASVMLLAACGGGQDDAEPAAQSARRARATSLPPGTTIPADAATRGMYGTLQSWPLITVHAVLMPDGRVMSYGTDGSGRQTP